MLSAVQIQSAHFSARPLQPSLGAEISDIDLRKPLTRKLRDSIYEALLKYKVVFFRDQDISREQHIAFARAFGDLDRELLSHPDHPEILQLIVDGQSKFGTDIWHIDNGWRPAPSCASVVRAYVVPSLGGDTVFSNAAAAYDGLDSQTKERIQNLRAVQSAFHSEKAAGMARTTQDKLQERAHSDVTYPLVRVHPDTGARLLFVNERYTKHIVGLDPAESDALLRHLTDQFKRPEYQVRFGWQPHSIAMWDNRSVQHYGVTDYAGPRHLERVTIAGAPPVGPLQLPEPHTLPML